MDYVESLQNTSNNGTNTSQSHCGHINASSYLLLFVFRVSITSVMITLAFASNILLLCILWRVKSTRKIKNECYGYYLLNLCATDLLAAIICTTCTALYRFNDTCNHFTLFWRTYSSLQILLSSGWIATVAVMIMERLLLNKNPLLKRKTFQRMKNKLNVVWVWAIFNSLPQLILYQHVNVEVHCSCKMSSESESIYKRIYVAVRLTSMFAIPSFIILISSVGVLAPHSTESALSLKRKKGHRRFVYLVVTLWATFLLSNLPKHLFDLVASFDLVNTERLQSEQISMYVLLTSWTIYLTTPVIYMVIYGKSLKPELKKLLYRNSFRSGGSFYINRRASLFSNKGSDEGDIESYLTRRLFRNIGILDGNMIQNLSFDLCKEEGSYTRRTSLLGESTRKHSLLGSVMGDNCRHSLFRKKSVTAEGLMNVMEGRFLTSLVPTYEHSVNRLNQKIPLLESKKSRRRISINI